MISAGSAVRADDFVSTSSGAADSGKVAKLNAVGQIDADFLPNSLKTQVAQIEHNIMELYMENYFSSKVTPYQGLFFDGFSDSGTKSLTNSTTLSVGESAAATTLRVASTSGFAVGQPITIYDGTTYTDDRYITAISLGVIAVDSVTDQKDGSTGTSWTFAHSCSGSNRILFVSLTIYSGSDLVTGITYNGVAMTRVATVQSIDGDQRQYLYYLVAPATGSNNVVVSASSSVFMAGGAISYTGAKQTGQPDANTTGTTGQGSSSTATLSSVANNCWMVVGWGNNGGYGYSSSVTNGYLRVGRTSAGAGGGTAIVDSNAVITPAGSLAITVSTASSNQKWFYVAATIAPADNTLTINSGLTNTYSAGAAVKNTTATINTTDKKITPTASVGNGKNFRYHSKIQAFSQAMASARVWYSRAVTAEFNLSASASSGQAVVTVSGDKTTKFAAGDTIELYPSSKFPRERKTISTISYSGGTGLTTITMTSNLSNAYTSSDYIGRVDVLPECSIVNTGATFSFASPTFVQAIYDAATGEVEDEYLYEPATANEDFMIRLLMSRVDTALSPYAKRLGVTLNV